jgi:hypothetical protein
MIEQKTLFQKNQKKSDVFPVEENPPPTSLPKPVDLAKPFDQEAMMWLRVSAARAIKTNDEAQFLKAIEGEINIKSGTKTINLSVKEAFLGKSFAQ